MTGTVSPSSVLVVVGLKIHKLGLIDYRNREAKGKD